MEFQMIFFTRQAPATNVSARPNSLFFIILPRLKRKINRIAEDSATIFSIFVFFFYSLSYLRRGDAYLINDMKKHFFRYAAFRRFIKRLFCAAFVCACFFALFSCAKKRFDLYDYVSECRGNVLVAETAESGNKTADEISLLTVYSIERESPYLSDGAKGEMQKLTSFYFCAKDGSAVYSLKYENGDICGGGEASYDDVKKQYYYTCPSDTSLATSLRVEITDEKSKHTYSFLAKSVRTETTLSPRDVLARLSETESELIGSLREENVFLGEIRLRLISSEGKNYYYAGIVDRKNSVRSFLLDGETGKILAKRESNED